MAKSAADGHENRRVPVSWATDEHQELLGRFGLFDTCREMVSDTVKNSSTCSGGLLDPAENISLELGVHQMRDTAG